MKKIIFCLGLLVCLVSQAFAADDKTIVVGVTPFPHKDIMLIAKPLLEKEGYTLELKDFSDYVQPNVNLAEGHLTANFFQHIPYLENMNQERKLDLAWVAKVHIEPLGLYSKKIKSLDELKAGDTLAVPNDPTNGARALRLLEKHGLITLKPGELVMAKDITNNPRGLKFIELEAAQLPRTLVDVTASVINTNFAVEADMIPSRDAIIIEGEDSPYANIIVVREKDKDSPAVKALVKAVTSPEVKKFIVEELAPKGIVAAF
ncbi:MetQ/NlpA family ABC transporter substrate-binding protein [Desulfovibrio sp. OttesenSCG-928-F20]|nr:MetQ/NlpA family ABC transporter substrate-binding protein [Desulfovibrio sp. OttesenSCG-928-M16]MDL2291011.1 MetQ/NlpA family ABC transporter substrate-binding protein [Desulfovibrio sp. OttesenSCG-928-F20]